MGSHPKLRWTRLLTPTLLLCALLLNSCATTFDLGLTESYYNAANYRAALQSIEGRSNQLLKAQGPIVLNYDLGMLSRLASDWKRSNELLDESERLIAEARTRSISASLASFIINDNTRPYEGTDYEDLYINIFKAMNYLALGESEAALVELRRSTEKQAALQQRWEHSQQKIASYARQNGLPYDGSQIYAAAFSTSALANWLTAIVADHLEDRSLAEYSHRQISHAFSSQPTLYPFPLPKAVHNQKRGQIHFISFVGRAPMKEERWQYLYWDEYNRIRVAYPVLVERGTAVASITVTVGGQEINLEPLESISRIAIDTFGPTSQIALQKSTLRSMARMFGIAVSDNLSASEDEGTSFFGDLLGLFFSISGEVAERADVRTTHFLPAQAWVASLDLEPGTYDVKAAYRTKTGHTLAQESVGSITVDSSSLSIVELTFPR